MSSRALRKIQREQELQKQLAAARELEESEAEEEEPEILQQEQKPKNAYDMLEGMDDEDEDEDQDEVERGSDTVTAEPEAAIQHDPTESKTHTPSKPKKKKKKAKKKGKEKPTESEKSEQKDSGDEIDRALKEISAKDLATRDADDVSPSISNWEASATRLLAIDSKHLNPVNEMKSLFGNIAVEGQETRPNQRNQRRREVNAQGGVDLGTALTGRYNLASRGKELGALALRRNVFVQGKEEWPLALSGGLSMEHLPDSESFEKRYNIMHNTMYQEVQMLFRLTVESMDPQRMIALLAHHPYHISTLLQVSEIARHQGDHSVSGDLLERALFSFGRSVHSTFPAALREGTSRLTFDKPENRELYLAVWRYMRSLEMRGTWRTAFEWAKILLQFNTLSDPYGVTLMIDQLGLRGRQHTQLISLSSDSAYGTAWRYLPNIQISLSLAYLRAGKPRDARQQLAIAMHHYPYILSALASDLDISPLPKALWAKIPSTDAEKLYTQLYVTRAKDLWNTPETSALIVEVAETLSHYSQAIESFPSAPKLEISLEDARHIMLLEIPALIAILPRHFTTMPTSSSDVLPPPQDAANSEFVARAPGASGLGSLQNILATAAENTAGITGGALQRILNWFHTPAGPNGAIGGPGATAGAEGEAEADGNREMSREMIGNLIRMHLDDAEEQEQGQDNGMQHAGMAGDRHPYERQDNADDDEDDSMPDLEEPVETQRRNPHAAMVEEDIDEDEDDHHRSMATGNGGAILRHVDSDDEDEAHVQQVSSTPAARAPATTASSAAEIALDESDPQRVQRWLLSAGLSSLQSDPSSIGLYVRRLEMLRKPQQEWILNMVRQRAGATLVERVKVALG